MDTTKQDQRETPDPTGKSPFEILDPLLQELDQINYLQQTLIQIGESSDDIPARIVFYLGRRLGDHLGVMERGVNEAWKAWIEKDPNLVLPDPTKAGGAS